MAAQRKQYGEHRARHDPPFLLAPEGEQAQHEQEDGDGAHVHRPGREGLRAPVEREVLGKLLQVGLPRPLEQLVGLGMFRIDRPGGRTAVEVGNQQVGQFLPAVRPGRGVVEVQALGPRAAFRSLGAAAAHGIRGVFHRGQEFDGVGGDAGDAQDQQQCRCCEEAAPEAFFPDRHHQHDDVDQDQQREVVGDLRMVGLDLEAQRQAEQRRPEDGARQPTVFPGRGGSCLRSAAAPGLPATVGDSQSLVISKDQRSEYPGQERQGLHLRIVADLDDLQVVGAERDGDGAAHGNQRMDAEGEHQQPRAQQRKEEVGGRAAARQQEIIDRLRPVALRGGVDGGRRHAAEHGLRPGGLVVGMGGVPFHHLVGHALPAGDVALVDDLAAQDLGDIGVGEYEQADHDAGI